MLSARNNHYWFWFTVFGVVSCLAVLRTRGTLDAEAVWLLVTGLIGVLLGIGGHSLQLARPYDLIVGLLFTLVGLYGLLHNLGYTIVSADASPATTVIQSELVGLSLALPYALIHLLLGLMTLDQGIRTPGHSSSGKGDASGKAA